MRNTRRWSMCVVMICAVAGSVQAWGELSLYVSYYYAGKDAYEQGYYQDADALLRAAMSETEKPFRRAGALDTLGCMSMALERYDEAEDYFHQALAIKEKRFGERSRFVATTLNNLADLYYVSGRMADVEALYRRALDINERDQKNVDVCRALNGLALLHNRAQQTVEAERLLKRAVVLHEKARRREHPYLATALVNLGILYLNQGRYADAQKNLDRAAYVQEVGLRPDHPDVSVRLRAQAALCTALGSVDAAAQYAEAADAIRVRQHEAGNLAADAVYPPETGLAQSN